MRPVLNVALAAALALGAPAGHAGRSCDARPLAVSALQDGLALAERVAQRLDDSGAEVVVLARVGQDLRRYGLRYSHLGLAYRASSSAETASGASVWRVVHKLNHCNSTRASLYRQGLGEFFLDDLYAFEAGFVAPEPALQRRLAELLRDDRRVRLMHTPAYSMVAYPWSVTYQQSNQWGLETLTHAAEPAVTDRAAAQAWLRTQGYEPGVLRLGALKRLGAQVTTANVSFDDHPNAKRFGNRIETVTVDSVFAWLERSGLGGTVQTVH